VRDEVEALLFRYATAIDRKEWARLDEVFLPDARIDFRAVGGVAGSYAEVRPWLEASMARYRVLQHFVTNVRIADEGGRLTALAYVHAIHGEKPRSRGAMAFFELGGEYEDLLARTPAGLRIAERTLHLRFVRGDLPAGDDRRD
jgi:3-phenylpropionate/cinnamic acid dioxygenase small subunit